MKIHIIGIPRNPSTPSIGMDPYAMVSYYLTTYLHRKGHDVHYYGYEHSTVECNHKWVCVTEDHHKKYYDQDKSKHWIDNNESTDIFATNVGSKLSDNSSDGEIVICMWTTLVDMLSSKFPTLKFIDGHIGHRYPSLKTQYHVYASHSNRHLCYGKHNLDNHWFDTTIYPMANELSNFEYNEKKKNYFLFMGRKNEDKGLGIFLSLAKHFKDKEFILAGQGTHQFEVPPNVKELGLLNIVQRKEYLSNAKAVISPSYYAEPFGLTAIEAGLSGTPIICTDHGGYTESVIDGVTGFRCSYFNDFVEAINNIKDIKPTTCRTNAERFTAEVLINDWEKYLHKVNKEGWYDLD